jgi:hypothetical protein
MRQYGHAPAPDRLRYLDQAESIFSKAEALRPGEHAYNLACVAALRHQAADCVKWLKKTKATNHLPGQLHIETDSYIANIKDSPEFAAWFAANFPAPSDAH